MGGAQAGEVASRLAAAALTGERLPMPTASSAIVDLIQEANRRVYERSSTDPNDVGHGHDDHCRARRGRHVTFGHVGDSRAYLIRDGEHGAAHRGPLARQRAGEDGEASAEEAEPHPQRSVITRALGTDPDVDVDTFTSSRRPATSSSSAPTG